MVVKITVEYGNTKTVLGNINVQKWENDINECEIKILGCQVMLDVMSDDATDSDKEIAVEFGWDDKTKKDTEFKLRHNIVQLGFKKLNVLLFKTLYANKDLSKLLPLLKIKYEKNFMEALEILQEEVDTGFIDEGGYIKIVNAIKSKYEEHLIKINMFEKIVDGCEYRIEVE